MSRSGRQLLFGSAIAAAGALVWWVAGSTGPRDAAPQAPARGLEQEAPARDDELVEPLDRAPIEPADGGEATTREAVDEESAAARTASVSGALLDPEGRPVDDVAVVFVDALGEQRAAVVEEASYHLEGLGAGNWWAVPSRRGWHSGGARIEALERGEERRVDLVLRENRVIEVVVATPDGQRYDGITRPGSGLALRGSFSAFEPVATLVPLGERLLARGDRSGGFAGVGRFTAANGKKDPDELLGRLELRVEPPLYVSLVSHQAVIASQLVAEPTERIVFAVDPERFELSLASVRFRLIDANGAPVQQARPVLFLSGNATLTINSSEREEWTGLPPGEYGLRWLEGGVFRSFELQAGERLDLGDIAIGERRMLSGRVLTADGTPPAAPNEEAASYLALGRVTAGGGRIDRNNRVKAGSTFELGLSPDQYLFQWYGQKVVTRPFLVDLREEDRSLELVAERPAILVLEPDEERWPGNLFAVLDEQGIELERRAFPGPFPLRLEFPPGRVRVQVVSADGKLELERAVTLGPRPSRLALGR